MTNKITRKEELRKEYIKIAEAGFFESQEAIANWWLGFLFPEEEERIGIVPVPRSGYGGIPKHTAEGIVNLGKVPEKLVETEFAFIEEAAPYSRENRKKINQILSYLETLNR